ncbi:MAG: B12-binding domain-containing radical SAM protein [Elusimicrobia bacterium]|nr:B12-binding domain-containing radical SAM protein [Elusimicrobiota bacterium]
MTLGILKVAAVLEKAGHEVEMLDLSGIQNFEDVISIHLKNSSAKIFGVTATTPQMPAAAKIIRRIRLDRPDAKVILGGPHITLVHAAYRREARKKIDGRATKAFNQLGELCDVLVAGDGEFAVFEAIKEGAPRLIDADDPAGALFLNNRTLNETPFPARHLVDVGSYHYSIDNVPALSMIAQLGCPFSCGFCGGRESPMLRRVRMRTSENVVEEMLQMHRKYGARGFMLYDDELNVNTKMVELMNLIDKAQKEIKTEFRLRGFIKAQLFTDEQAEAMRRAGFRWILTGFESGSPRILENINKRATREENTRCVEIARRHGLKVKALMSIGHPGETKKTIAETQQWLLEVKPDDFDVTIITTYPGSPYYDYAVPHPSKPGVWVYTYEKTGDSLYSFEVDYTQVADYYKGDPDGGYRSFVYTDTLAPEELVALRDHTEREVRKTLNIPFNPSASSVRYEHSMGQTGGGLPSKILRSSSLAPKAA